MLRFAYGPPRRTGFLPRSGKRKTPLCKRRCLLAPGAGHAVLPSADTTVPRAGKSALHWAAAVNNVEATLLLLKNGANRDMQDNKVRCRLRAGGQARQRLRMWGLPSPPLPSPPGEKQRHREEQEGQGRGPRSRSEGGGLCREGSGSSPPPARPPACARPSRKGLRCPRLGLRPRGLRLPASPRCAPGHARLPRRLSCCASSPLLSTGTCPVGLSSSELGATPPLPGSSSLLFSLFPLSVLVHVFSLLALTFSRFCRFPLGAVC